MAQQFVIHPDNPQLRLIRLVVEQLHQGAVVVYPTDSAYALGCHMGDKQALERIRRLRELDKHHNFTLVCRDLSELAKYARVSNSVFRSLKAHTPGPFTFILEASQEVPRRLMQAKRKTIGLRVPDHPVALAILEELGEPLMSVSLIMPGEEYPLSEPDVIMDRLANQVDVIIDGGACGFEPTTVVDFVGETPVILRQGKGTGITA